MMLTDVNVLINAFRRDAVRHGEYRDWLENALAAEAIFGYSDLVMSSVVRILTHPRIFAHPNTCKEAFAYVDFIRSQPNSLAVNPGPRHWDIFQGLCGEGKARGNLVTDAYLAALAIESGAEWITADRDFARFPKLRWRHPLA